jgi:hypothetical protein
MKVYTGGRCIGSGVLLGKTRQIREEIIETPKFEPKQSLGTGLESKLRDLTLKKKPKNIVFQM